MKEVKSFIEEKKGEIISVKNPSNTLENLFLKIVQERRRSSESILSGDSDKNKTDYH